ncbi:bacteriophage protein [Salmonella enterica subsp. enterica]|uniref:Bacteriophage protein n=1 Tax=Salmonella enterica I TaxID=59201 RepID=A0A3S4HZE6_SALET|nr:bacteriophage protein [Salmonella enterica subsp. enterica]
MPPDPQRGFFVTKGCLKYSGDLVRVTQIINGG